MSLFLFVSHLVRLALEEQPVLTQSMEMEVSSVLHPHSVLWVLLCLRAVLLEPTIQLWELQLVPTVLLARCVLET